VRITPTPILPREKIPVPLGRPQCQFGRLGEEQNVFVVSALACNGKLTDTTCDVIILQVLTQAERVA